MTIDDRGRLLRKQALFTFFQSFMLAWLIAIVGVVILAGQVLAYSKLRKSLVPDKLSATVNLRRNLS